MARRRSRSADLMWTAYNLLKDKGFDDFVSMHAALEEQLGDLGPTTRPKASQKPATPGGTQSPPPVPAAPPTPSVKKADVDFDDAG